MATVTSKRTKTDGVSREWLWVLTGGTLVMLFFTLGLPLWWDDYGLWLERANTAFGSALKDLLLPVASDRPGQTILYKILHTVFGYWGGGFRIVKALAFGALCAFAYRGMLRMGVTRLAALLVLGIFSLATGPLTSVMIHSEFSVYALLIALPLLLYSHDAIENSTVRTPAESDLFKFGAWPKAFLRFSLIFIAAIYFGSKVDGVVRIVPITLLAYLGLYHREKVKAFAIPMGTAIVLSLPWSATLPRYLFSFSLGRVFPFITGELFSWSSMARSVFAALGLLVFFGLAVYGVYALIRRQAGAPDRTMGFTLIWLAVSLLSLGFVPRENPTFDVRYTLIPMLPAVFFAGMALSKAMADFRRAKWFMPVLCAVFAIQGLVHLSHSYVQRRDLGHTMVAVQKMYETIEQKYPNHRVVYLPGFLNYPFRPSSAPALSQRQAIGGVNDLAAYPAGQTLAIGWSSLLDQRLALAEVASGCTSSLFDLVFPCGKADGALLFKYVGNPPAVAQAQQLEQENKLPAARDTLDAYLRTEPGNHSVAFVLSLYAYRLGDFPRMERLYDELVPFFPAHSSIMYNAGLAKMGVNKHAEAAELLGKAYKLLPLNYGVGFNLASAYFQAGKKRRAIATMDELMKKYPADQALKTAYDQWSK